MQENTEDKMFAELLSDYAEPAEDNGFSQFVLASLPRPQSQQRLKSLLVGGAGALGAAIAATQLKGLLSFTKGLTIPTLEAPTVDMTALANSSLMGSTYAPVFLGLGLLTALWIAQTLIFGDGA